MVRRLAALLLWMAAPAAAQPVVVSPGPDSVSVTVYRDHRRGIDREMDLGFLGGYALVTEERTVDLPAGPSVIRFEGVAGNILPVSAIVSGLPGRAPEKNYDARLLSPGSLVSAFLGRQVHIRRTNRATGATVETEAILRSGPGGIVLQTSEGVEALRCTGLPAGLLYPEVPADLSDKPTLAVQTEAAAPARATLRLSYLAGQFDWQANYVAHLAADGRTLDLFAWLTLANGNDESFAAAQTQAVAGTVDRVEGEGDEGVEPVSPQISLECWPAGTTSDIPDLTLPPPPPAAEYEMTGATIVVTGSRIRHPNLYSMSPITAISARQEELGDLKLYRIPEPVTVAANGQKQIALLSRSKVPIERINAMWVPAGQASNPLPAGIHLRTKNVEARRLGLPLPMGPLAIYEEVGGREMLTARGAIGDSAVGQEVEIFVGENPGVLVGQRFIPPKASKAAGRDEEEDDDDGDGDGDRAGRYQIEISNATSQAVDVEVKLVLAYSGGGIIRRPSRKLATKDGRRVWRTQVAAGKRATLSYVYTPGPPPRDEDD